MKDIETLMATIVAMYRIEEKIKSSSAEFKDTQHLEKGLHALGEKYNALFNTLDIDSQNKIKFIFIDEDPQVPQLLKSFNLFKGDLPNFIEDEVIQKALEINDDLFKGTTLNTANLTPVRREVRSKNGRMYLKTVWIKKEEMSEITHRGRSFLAQYESEKTMKVGDNISVKFLGWASGKNYVSDDLVIDKINKEENYIIAKFTTKPIVTQIDTGAISTYKYGPNASDNRGKEIKIPLTTSKDWNEKTSFVIKEKLQQPSIINSILDISVGDTVLTQDGNETKKVTIKYIHPNGDFIKVRTEDGRDLRRTLQKIKKPTSTSIEEGFLLNDEKFLELRQMGVSMDNLSEPPNSSGNLKRMRIFNTIMPNFNLKEWFEDSKKYIAEKFGQNYADQCEFLFRTPSSSEVVLKIVNENDYNKHMIINRKFSRPDNELTVYHSLFRLGSEIQNNNIGKLLFKALNKQYKKAGVSKITVTANIDVGGYTWGRYGFMTSAANAKDLVKKFVIGKSNSKILGYKITARDKVEAQERFTNFYRENPADADFPMNLLCTIGPDHKAGKIALMGTSWDGKINLTNPEQKAHFENYIGMSGE